MIDLYYWPTPNGHKISIYLEEAELEYRMRTVNINQGDQFKPEFLKISPNNRVPAIVDHDGKDGPISIFESGAILLYLGEKTGKFMPENHYNRWQVLQWLFWQMGGLGPMMGQANHFTSYAEQVDPDCDHTYGRERYQNEVRRLFSVMDRALANKEFLAGDYSIADIACWPWVSRYTRYDFILSDWPNLNRWSDEIGAHPAVERALEAGRKVRKESKKLSPAAKSNLYGKR